MVPLGQGILSMQFPPGLGYRCFGSQDSGLMELDAMRTLGRMAKWKTHLGGDHSQGLCGSCEYALPRATCLGE